jgi:hypothetical protein
MILSEFTSANPMLPGFQNEEDDNSTLKVSDVRKTRLTLLQLNKLRKMNDVREYEREKKLDSVSKQYKAAAPEGGAMPGL